MPERVRPTSARPPRRRATVGQFVGIFYGCLGSWLGITTTTECAQMVLAAEPGTTTMLDRIG